MNRRGFMKSVIGASVVIGLGGQNVSAQRGRRDANEGEVDQSVRDAEAKGTRGWANEDYSLGISTAVSVFLTDEAAKDLIEEHLAFPQEMSEVNGWKFKRIILSHEVENMGDESIAFRMEDVNGVDFNYVVVRVGRLIYMFTAFWTVSAIKNFGTSIMVEVIDRAEVDSDMSMAEIMALLPTAEEVAPHGLTEMYDESFDS